MENENWYVFYTKPRSELKALVDLSFKYEHCFLPKREEIRQWKDRRKKVIVPLFPSYIFLKIPITEIHYVLATYYIVKTIKFGDKFAYLRNEEVNCIKKMVDTGSQISVNNSFIIGDEVEVVDGPLIGVKGILSMQRNQNRFALNLNSIGQSLIVEIDSASLRKTKSVKRSLAYG